METLGNNDFKIKFGKRIKQLRILAELTQKELATKIGYKDKQVINAYEIKGANPTAYTLQLLANALSVNINELFDFSKLKD